MALKQLAEAVYCPDELIDEAKKGNLVVFAGAGVSAPSGIPCFTELFTDLLGEFPEVPPPSGVSDGDRRAIYDYFKILEDSNKAFKEVIIRSIKARAYKPNDLHTAISCLFPDGKPTRIITTNYDTLLAEKLDELLGAPTCWLAPGLPADEAFDGIVFLHGSITSESSDIVISKRDFVRAYMGGSRYGYGFLHEVFVNCVVLWVGFSFQDPLFEFILQPCSNKPFEFYSFVPLDSAKMKACRDLDVRPVDYPYGPPEKKHCHLVEAIKNLASMINPSRMRAVIGSRKKPEPEDYSEYAKRMARITSSTRRA